MDYYVDASPTWGPEAAGLAGPTNASLLGDFGNYSDALLDNSTAANATANDINSFYFFHTAQFAVLWVLFVLIVPGNSAVLLALAFNKHRKSRMNFFIMQLAIADLAVGLISVPTDLAWRMTVAWHAGNLACKLIRFLQVMVTYSSTYVLVALSIDRYDAITHPMNFSTSGRRSRILVAGAWTLSFLFAVPTLLLFEEREVQGQRQCWIELPQPWHWRLYVTLVALVVFALPAIIISACYTVIVCTIWNKSHGLTGPSRRPRATHRALIPGPLLERVKSVPTRWRCSQDDAGLPDAAAGSARGGSSRCKGRVSSFRPRPFTATPAGGSFGPPKEEPDCRRASSRGLIPRAKVKTVKMTLVIVFVFVLCWSPYFVLNLLQVYDHIPRTQSNIAVASFVQSLAPLNSAANPLIYCLFSTHICRTLRCRPSRGRGRCATSRPPSRTTRRPPRRR
ncbi:neuropeptide S receptor-like [Thrips palmi]|uniref:Neuropeptide S receptor-like n=1 Tax=Thrips palmi TaxID=161013 RepID=A0A6P8YDI7_THRPL|nr:neuropeptide S receptor-like [Thrips palmi]